MNIYFYQAECGDAARIRYTGVDGTVHNILIDSGYERSFAYVLRQQISEIVESGEMIDLWIVSHIHDDHIGGVVKYIASVKIGEFADRVNEWFYNIPRPRTLTENSGGLEAISQIKSIDQGDILTGYLSSIGKLRDEDITSGTPSSTYHGLEIKVLSPSPEKLSMLREKYKLPGIALERNEDEAISDASKARGYDYATKVNDFNLDKWKEDDSKENGSSISVLTTLEGKNILWLADSHPSDVANALKDLGYDKDYKIRCELVKVTHHGSKGNNSNALYDLIDCENYLMSVNGENRHYLPTKEAMVRIIRNGNRKEGSHYRFYFPYDNEVLRSIFISDGPEVFQEYDFEVIYLKVGKYLQFEL